MRDRKTARAEALEIPIVGSGDRVWVTVATRNMLVIHLLCHEFREEECASGGGKAIEEHVATKRDAFAMGGGKHRKSTMTNREVK